jgi:hypothetical protein
MVWQIESCYYGFMRVVEINHGELVGFVRRLLCVDSCQPPSCLAIDCVSLSFVSLVSFGVGWVCCDVVFLCGSLSSSAALMYPDHRLSFLGDVCLIL